MRQRLNDIELRAKRREDSIGLPAGMKGLSEGHEPHMLDVANLVHESWEKISKETVCRCWIKSRMLPIHIEKDLEGTYGKLMKVEEPSVGEISQLLNKLSIRLDASDPFYNAEPEFKPGDDVLRWIHIEEDLEVQQNMIDDVMDLVDNNECESAGNTISEAQHDESHAVVPLPPRHFFFNHLNELEKRIVNCDSKEVYYFLRRARNAYTLAKNAEERRRSSQLLITEMI